MEIILIRHGKPTTGINPALNAAGFASWVKRYNASDVSINSRPEKYSKKNLSSYYIISSDLKRAIHSAEIYTGKAPLQTHKLLREMEIPRYKLSFQLKAWTWVYLNRALWMLGKKGPFESYREAKIRAEIASSKLMKLAKEKKLVVFGHGYMNLHIRKNLIKDGWKLKIKNNDFWGITILERKPDV